MTSLKFVILFAFLISVTVARNFTPQGINLKGKPGHDLTVGSRLPGDKLVYKENIVKAGKWLQVVEVVKKMDIPRGMKITQILAKDLDKDGNGGFAKVISGGPQYSELTMKFTSQRGSPINFVIEIYAR